MAENPTEAFQEITDALVSEIDYTYRTNGAADRSLLGLVQAEQLVRQIAAANGVVIADTPRPTPGEIVAELTRATREGRM